MRAALLWILLGSCQALTLTHQPTSRDAEVETSPRQVNETALSELSECARACQQDVLTKQACTLADDCYCGSYSSQVYRSIDSCVQTTCPLLEELMQWQRFRASTCNIEPRNRALMQDLVTVLLFVLATITVIARFLSRWTRMGGPGFWWDDWVIFFVWMVSIQMIVILGLKSRDDAAWDSWAVTTEERNRALLWVYSSEPAYFIGTYGAKISLVLLYLRVLDGNPIFRKICWWTIAFNVMGILGFGIGSGIALWPPHYYKGVSAIPRDKLLGIDFQVSVFGIAATNIWLDCVVLLLPIGMLLKLRGISRKWKIWISVTFLAGFVATACSIVRLIYIFPLRNSTNVSWDFGWFGLWCEIEVHLSTVCCNLPPMAVLLKRRWIGKNRDCGESTRYVTGDTQGSGATRTTNMTQASQLSSVFSMMTGEWRRGDGFREEVDDMDPSDAEQRDPSDAEHPEVECTRDPRSGSSLSKRE